MQIVYGTILEQDLSGALHQYRVMLSTSILSPWVPAVDIVAGTSRKNHSLSAGTQVVMALGDYEGVILGTLNSEQHPAVTDSDALDRAVYPDGALIEYDAKASVRKHTYPDGAVIEYNAKSSALSATLPPGATVLIVSTGGLTMVGNIAITGNVAVTGTINAVGNILSAADVQAGDISLKNHTHAGDSGGTTSAPQ